MMNKIDDHIINWGNYKIIWVDSRDIIGSLNFYNTQKIDGIGISIDHGFKETDISFIKSVKKLNGLVIVDRNKIDIGPISECRHLKFLSVSGNKQLINYGKLIELVDLSLEWHKNIIFPSDNVNLKRLYLRNYKEKNLNKLPRYDSLETLELVNSSIESIHGIELFKNLLYCDFSFCLKLNDITLISKLLKLNVIHIEACKNIKDFSILELCEKLSVLRLNNCGDIPSISFINKIVNLEEFRFVKTNVLDGDMTPCLKLSKVGFMSKRHYSHTIEEIERLIQVNKKK